MSGKRVPCATYRLQFNRDFPFPAAREIVEYLNRLGITDIYSSPVLRAVPGSVHCYDTIDHSSVNRELGGEDELRLLAAELQTRNMGLVVDTVPNHMGINHEDNRWWWDVLENGPSSRFATYFDIDWHPPKPELRNRVLIPVLGAQYGQVLDNQELNLEFSKGAFCLRYYKKLLPLDPRTWLLILNPAREFLKNLSPVDEHVVEFESILTALSHLPRRTENSPENIEERQREKAVVRKRLLTLAEISGSVRQAIEEAVTILNGVKGDPQSFDPLSRIVNDQAYRLSFWRVAADEINYRRFFDINELAAIRVELPPVFEAVHEVVIRLIAEGIVTGLRIDHPDGLFNPRRYFADLQDACRTAMAAESRSNKAPWVIVEKILGRAERLRTDWDVHGTTGYEYLNLLNGIFVNQESSREMLRTYSQFTGRYTPFSLLMYDCKTMILESSMSGELHVLARRLDRISEQHRYTRDFTLASLQSALADVISAFPVYRTYVCPEDETVGEDDRHHIQAAVRTAKRRNPEVDPSVYTFIQSVLQLEHPENLTEEQIHSRKDFVLRFQQMTGPVMAKGLEDTAFYREFPLLSLNEVGGEPDHFGVSVDEFHRANLHRLETWPDSMLTTSTHDTKRSEDVRARINVLTEIPRSWSQAVRRWRNMNRKKKQQADGIHVPAAAEEYLLYQTMVGTWPFAESELPDFVTRLQSYLIKAAREGKKYTSWINVAEPHERALADFAGRLLDSRDSRKFLADFRAFHSLIAPAGAVNSLAQVLIKCFSPGVPDFYQGMELWNFTLVDPDNRRPVDYTLRQSVLKDILMQAATPDTASGIAADWKSGAIKLFVTHRLLQFRKQHADLFQCGNYVPLTVEGPLQNHICAFARRLNELWAIAVAPRFVSRLLEPEQLSFQSDVWKETSVLLPADSPTNWKEMFTGSRILPAEHAQRLPAALLFKHFPVCSLINC